MYNTWNQLSRQPLFCTRCGQGLEPYNLEEGYDAYTGKRGFKDYLVCPDAKTSLLHTQHDVWEVEANVNSFAEMGYV